MYNIERWLKLALFLIIIWSNKDPGYFQLVSLFSQIIAKNFFLNPNLN